MSHSPFTVSIFQLQVLKDATVLPVTAHQVPEQTNKYTNTKNIHNNIQPFHPNKNVSKLLGISKQFVEKKDSKQCFLGRIFYLEAKVLNIKWWKDLISNIDELIFSKQGFSIEQYHISFDLENPMKSSMWVDL